MVQRSHFVKPNVETKRYEGGPLLPQLEARYKLTWVCPSMRVSPNHPKAMAFSSRKQAFWGTRSHGRNHMGDMHQANAFSQLVSHSYVSRKMLDIVSKSHKHAMWMRIQLAGPWAKNWFKINHATERSVIFDDVILHGFKYRVKPPHYSRTYFSKVSVTLGTNQTQIFLSWQKLGDLSVSSLAVSILEQLQRDIIAFGGSLYTHAAIVRFVLMGLDSVPTC